MRSLTSSTWRRGPFRLVILIVICSLVLPEMAFSRAPVAPVQPVPPDAALCQKGFMASQAPQVSADCPTPDGAPATADVVPSGFQETTALSGLTNPTVLRFAADGRVFVAEKSGAIKVFDNLADPTPTSYTGLQTNVHNFWDRGLLGMALDPSLTGGSGSGSYLYVLYAYNHVLGDVAAAPRWANDGCPSPPGPTTDGCVVSGRLSRLNVSGSTVSGPETVLIEDWCQQDPSHSVGTLTFGPDGALYVSSGDGANFNTVDYGQRGGTSLSVVTPRNPCGDPPGGSMTPPGAEGGALRSQDIRTTGVGSEYRHRVIVDAPIAYWRLGEASGTTVGRELGVIATYVGGPTFGVPGVISADPNTAVILDGSTEYISVADSAPYRFDGTTPFSAEVWFKHTADGTYRRIMSAENGSGLGWQLYSQASSWGFVRNGTGGAAEVSDGTPAGPGWVHAVATYDGTTMRLYENGVEMPFPILSSQSLPSDTSFFVGRYGGADVSHFNGSIDEPAVYNYALSAAQVAAHYAAGTTPVIEPTGLDGTVLRLDPATGAGLPGNPFFASNDANERRIIASGLRNPFRMTFRPGTSELWVGDVGWTTWEEINRIPNATDSVAENFGWPCYEGGSRQSGYDGANLSVCESLYAEGSGAIASPLYAYNHSAKVVAGETCPTGSSSVTGLAFYPESGGSFPAAYNGGLFFADHSRNCIWFIPKGADGQPDPNLRQTFVTAAANPVDLVIGANGDLFYVDFDGGTIRRIAGTGSNQAPTAVIQAVPTSGPVPLDVEFSGSGSSDPEGTQLTYAWDLDGDGAYDDATGVTTSWTYASPGNVTVGLRVTDAGSASGTDTQVISASNDPPVPVINTPTAGSTWKVGDLITFSGSATDPQDGALPASALTWTLVQRHCSPNCHSHVVQTFPGVASGQFNAPDHEYPSNLELTLTATDSFGTQTSVTRQLDPQTVVLTFQTAPTGLALAVNATSSTAPFARTVIVGSANSVTATSPQTVTGSTHTFVSWSDGGAQSHTITAPATATTYTATYQTSTAITILPTADSQIRSNQANKNFGTATVLRVRLNQSRVYLKFVVSGLTGAPTSARLRLWVTNGGTNGGSCYQIANTTWTETGITWNNAPVITGSPLSVGGTSTAGTWVEFNLGSAISGNGTYTFAISNGNNDAVDYASRETTSDPQLVLTP